VRSYAPLLALVLVSCAGAPFPRETQAANARTDDPWLEGPTCTPEAPEGAALRFDEVDLGTGAPVERGQTVRVHYSAAIAPNGETLHDTHRESLPVEIVIGSTKTICGFEKALVGMRPGGRRRVFVPWQLAFGEAGKAPEVPPRTDLVFLVDLYLPADAAFERRGSPVNPVGPMRRR
jgi:FKBP-type peptidyl-prolyl cis-trans isomerase